MRDLLTRIGGVDQCVTEFLRVTDKLYPESVFYKNCPELKMQSKTQNQTPVFIQLLGGHAEPLALNAERAVQLGALGVDLNFGCPAKTVNRHDGGATLLKTTSRLYNIVKTVRDKVPAHIPVTAKIRLGFDQPEACIDNAKAIEDAGATWLTVHCRTKTDGYRPPAYWEWIPKIKNKVSMPIVANGEIWSLEDFKRCSDITGCDQFMIGRGALKNPYLFLEIKNNQKTYNADVLSHIPDFYNSCTLFVNENFAVSRTKQWLNQLRSTSLECETLFQKIKTLKNPDEFKFLLFTLIKHQVDPLHQESSNLCNHQ